MSPVIYASDQHNEFVSLGSRLHVYLFLKYTEERGLRSKLRVKSYRPMELHKQERRSDPNLPPSFLCSLTSPPPHFPRISRL